VVPGVARNQLSIRSPSQPQRARARDATPVHSAGSPLRRLYRTRAFTSQFAAPDARIHESCTRKRANIDMESRGGVEGLAYDAVPSRKLASVSREDGTWEVRARTRLVTFRCLLPPPWPRA
jgi:hypothetical protein